jgi:hypothetical protein
LWLVLADPVQIEHVILNLAINARDAMPEGGVLSIATANVAGTAQRGASQRGDETLPAGDYISVAVADTGTGMTEEILRNAFEPFFTTKPVGHGSGLGLSQVHGMASRSGGRVRIESAPGRGTTVTVLLPRAEPDALPVGPAATARQSTGRPKRARQITQRQTTPRQAAAWQVAAQQTPAQEGPLPHVARTRIAGPAARA